MRLKCRIKITFLISPSISITHALKSTLPASPYSLSISTASESPCQSILAFPPPPPSLLPKENPPIYALSILFSPLSSASSFSFFYSSSSFSPTPQTSPGLQPSHFHSLSGLCIHESLTHLYQHNRLSPIPKSWGLSG